MATVMLASSAESAPGDATPAAAASDRPPVVWTSALFERSGYAEEARNILLALRQAGVPVAADPLRWMPWQRPLPAQDAEQLERLLALELPQRFVHVMHFGAHGFVRHPRAVRSIGRTMWETDGLPPDWVARCNEMDEVWVPSEFNLDTFERAGVAAAKLRKVPEGIHHLGAFDPTVPPLELPGLSGFVFLSILSWSRRKGWDVLVRAYLEEFGRDEDVTLMLLPTSFGRPVEEHLAELRRFVESDLGREFSRSARIVVLEIEPGPTVMPRLYRAADAYVQPSRGEGWGRTLMEAMAMGLPTIATRWSGNLEFMNDDNSYLLDYELCPVSAEAAHEWPRFRGQRWAEPSLDHLRALMRRVMDRPDEARARGRQARYDVYHRCTSANVAGAIVDCLDIPAPRVAPPADTDRPGRDGRAQPPSPVGRAASEDRYRAGLAAWEAGDREAALDRLRGLAVPADDPGGPPAAAAAHLAIAGVFQQAGDDGEAARHARRVLEIAPGHRRGYAVFAESLERLGLIEAALRAHARAVGDGAEDGTPGRPRRWLTARRRARSHRASDLAVVWTSSFFDRSGWSEDSRTAVLALDEAGIRTFADPLAWTRWGFDADPGIGRALERLLLIDLPEAFVHVGPTSPKFRRHPRAILQVGRALSETERLPASIAADCHRMDELWVPGEFSRQALLLAGVPAHKIHVVPEGVDRRVYGVEGEPLVLPGISGFVFLSVARWNTRKGWDLLVRAYVEEFRRDDDVMLVLKVEPFDPRALPGIRAFIRETLGRDPSTTARIVVLNMDLPPREMPRLYRAADAFVLPSRGEGWGRPYMEAMASGLATIGTGWSENTTFMNDSNAYLIDHRLVEVPEPGWREMLPFRGERWAEPSVEHLRSLMRHVFERPEEARSRGARARETILAGFGSERIAEAVAGRLRELEVLAPRANADGHRGSTASAGIFLRLARAALAAGRPGRATSLAQAALHLIPGSPEAYALMAAGLRRLGLEEAAGRAEAALAS